MSKNFLGLNYSGVHDSAVSVVTPAGRILLAVAEERFTRIKKDGRWPRHCLALFIVQTEGCQREPRRGRAVGAAVGCGCRGGGSCACGGCGCGGCGSSGGGVAVALMVTVGVDSHEPTGLAVDAVLAGCGWGGCCGWRARAELRSRRVISGWMPSLPHRVSSRQRHSYSSTWPLDGCPS